MPPLYRRMNSPGWLASITKSFLRCLGVLMRLAVVAAVCLSMVGLAAAADAQAAAIQDADEYSGARLGARAENAGEGSRVSSGV